MTTEAVKADAGKPETTQPEAQGAQSGEPTIAELIEQGRKQQPQAEQTPAGTEPKAPLKPANTQETVLQVRAQLRAEENFNVLAKKVSDENGISLAKAQSLLRGELTGRSDLAQAWLQQHINPDLWGKAADIWAKDVGKEFKGIAEKAKEQVSDKAAIRAGANLSPSAEAPPEKRPDIRRDPAARAAFHRKYGLPVT